MGFSNFSNLKICDFKFLNDNIYFCGLYESGNNDYAFIALLFI